MLERFGKTVAAALAIFLGGCAAAWAHGGEGAARPESFHELWKAWEWEPITVTCLALSGWLYVRGVRKIWRVIRPGKGIRYWEAACFAAGWLSLFIALISPLHPWGRVLFAVHMTQHEILMLVAAPLLVLSRPMIAFLKALPGPWARQLASVGNSAGWQSVWSKISSPIGAWLIHAVMLWIWHIPSWFQATIESELVHALQHSSFFFSALLFWWAVMHGQRRVTGYGFAVLYMFTTAMHSGMLGALITFAGLLIYPVYAGTTHAWGLTPMEDQQLGGLIMWVPAGLVYVIAGMAFLAGWMRESERRVLKHEWEELKVTSETIDSKEPQI
ncbi:MAG: cytochrome c oxidase assembly protein [Limisphaerales bacterium]